MERLGLMAAVLSSALGGTAIVATRYVVGALDPLTVGAVRFSGGFLVLFAVALIDRGRWPPRSDWPRAAALGLMFFALFPVLFNAALLYTTAARGALALSTVPVLTMLAGALLGIERPTLRKACGVVIAMVGVAIALGSSLSSAPDGAWRGDLIMVAGASCMALYNVWSRPFIARSGPLQFAALGMGTGALCLVLLSAATGGLSRLELLHDTQWLALAYLAIVGGALTFFLWAFALGRTTPTLVAVAVAVNPVTATLLAVPILREPISLNLLAGLVAVATGIIVAAGGNVWRRTSPSV